jgi:hypothetical protein
MYSVDSTSVMPARHLLRTYRLPLLAVCLVGVGFAIRLSGLRSQVTGQCSSYTLQGTTVQGLCVPAGTNPADACPTNSTPYMTTEACSANGASGVCRRCADQTAQQGASCRSTIYMKPVSEYDVPATEGGEHYLPSIIIANLNADSVPDAVVSRGSMGGFTVYVGKGNRSFSPGETYAGPGVAGDVLAGDFTGDGKVDIAIATANNGYYGLIYPGKGDGTFSTSPIALGASCGGHLSTLTSIDVPGAPQGFVLAGADEKNVYVFRSKGGGQFESPVVLPRTQGAKPDLAANHPLGFDTAYLSAKVTAADMNGDGKQDLLTADLHGNPELRLGDGTGGFAAPASVVPNPMQEGVDFAVGDFMSHDGKLDIAVITARSQVNPQAFFFMGQGGGTFYQAPLSQEIGGTSSEDQYSHENQPLRVVVKDITNDGYPDVIVTSYQNSTLWVMPGFDLTTQNGPYLDLIRARNHPFAITAGDLNGDGKSELLTTNFADGCTDAGSFTVFGNDMCANAGVDLQHTTFYSDDPPLAPPNEKWCASGAQPDQCGPIDTTPQCAASSSSSRSGGVSSSSSSKNASVASSSSRAGIAASSSSSDGGRSSSSSAAGGGIPWFCCTSRAACGGPYATFTDAKEGLCRPAQITPFQATSINVCLAYCAGSGNNGGNNGGDTSGNTGGNTGGADSGTNAGDASGDTGGNTGGNAAGTGDASGNTGGNAVRDTTSGDTGGGPVIQVNPNSPVVTNPPVTPVTPATVATNPGTDFLALSSVESHAAAEEPTLVNGTTEVTQGVPTGALNAPSQVGLTQPSQVASQIIDLLDPRAVGSAMNGSIAGQAQSTNGGGTGGNGPFDPGTNTQVAASLISIGHAPAGKTGPAALFAMAAGAASGWSWIRRRRR